MIDGVVLVCGGGGGGMPWVRTNQHLPNMTKQSKPAYGESVCDGGVGVMKR